MQNPVSGCQGEGMTNTNARVPDVVTALVSAGLVHSDRAAEARDVVTRALGEPATRSGGLRSKLAEIAGYVGGGLVVAAVFLFVAQQWEDFSDGAQVAILGGIAVLLTITGTVVSMLMGGYEELATGRDEVRRRLSSALLTAAGLAAAFAVGKVVEMAVARTEIADPWSAWPAFAAGLTMAVLAFGAYRYVASALGQLAIVGALYVVTMTGWDLLRSDGSGTLWPGLTLVAIGAAWVLLAERHFWRETIGARAIGAATALFGAQFVVFEGDYNAVGYALMALVAGASFALYLRTVSMPYLVIGVVGITLVVPEAIIDWTGDSIGTAGAVLVAGLSLLGAALAGLRIRKEATEDATT